MPVYKDGNNGTFYVQCYYRDARGSKRHKTKRGFSSEVEAAVWESQFKSLNGGAMDMTFSEFVEVYASEVRPRIREHTWITKEYIINDKLVPFFGDMRMCDVRPIDVIRWQNELTEHRDADDVDAHGVGQVAVAHEVRDALAHLVVEDPVVLFGEPGGGALPGLEEDLAADLVGGDGRGHDLELHVGVRREVVEQRAHHGEGRLARLLARGLVADVGELDRLAEHPGHHLGDSVPVHGVVADVGGHLARAVALPAAPLPLGLRALRGVLAPARAAEEQPEGARALRPILVLGSCSAHRARLLSSWPCASRAAPGGPVLALI